MVSAVKYRNDRAVVGRFAAELAHIAALWPSESGADLITWVPTTRARCAARGFDHSALLARGVARRLGVKARGLVSRSDHGHQTGQDRTGRLAGPHLALRRGIVVPRRVIVVDDVITTGASMAATAAVLRRGGARWVTGLAVTHRV